MGTDLEKDMNTLLEGGAIGGAAASTGGDEGEDSSKEGPVKDVTAVMDKFIASVNGNLAEIKSAGAMDFRFISDNKTIYCTNGEKKGEYDAVAGVLAPGASKEICDKILKTIKATVEGSGVNFNNISQYR
jgi:hypothetical protein